MKILVTGSSRGIGKRVSERFLKLGHEVYGLDLLSSSISHQNYHHYNVDVSIEKDLPHLEDMDVVFANAGKQNSEDDILNNLVGVINTVEKYGVHPHIKSILINASASAISGQEFPQYVASKSGLIGYMRNAAIRVAPYQATCNSISLGGVLTDSNKPVMEDKKSWEEIMKVTPMKKWMSEDEVADWVIFLTLNNKSMSGQNILIDNGEKDLNPTFVWPK